MVVSGGLKTACALGCLLAGCGRLPPMDERRACSADTGCAAEELCAPDGFCWRPPVLHPEAPAWVSAAFGPGRTAALVLWRPSAVERLDLFLRRGGSEQLLGSTAGSFWDGSLQQALPGDALVARAVRGGLAGPPSEPLLARLDGLTLAAQEAPGPSALLRVGRGSLPLDCYDPALLVERALAGGAWEEASLARDWSSSGCLVKLRGESSWLLRASLKLDPISRLVSAEVPVAILAIEPPAPPTNLTAACVDGGDLLRWTPAPRADQFEVTDDRERTVLARVPAPTAEVLIVGGPGSYRVRSVDRGTTGPGSEGAGIGLRPPPVQLFSATSGTGSIRLSWTSFSGPEYTFKLQAPHLSAPVRLATAREYDDATAPVLVPTTYALSLLDAKGCEGVSVKSAAALRTGPASFAFLGEGLALSATSTAVVRQGFTAEVAGRLAAIELDAFASYPLMQRPLLRVYSGGTLLGERQVQLPWNSAPSPLPLAADAVRGTLLDLSAFALDVAAGASLTAELAPAPGTPGVPFQAVLAPDAYPGGGADLGRPLPAADLPFKVFLRPGAAPRSGGPP